MNRRAFFKAAVAGLMATPAAVKAMASPAPWVPPVTIATTKVTWMTNGWRVVHGYCWERVEPKLWEMTVDGVDAKGHLVKRGFLVDELKPSDIMEMASKLEVRMPPPRVVLCQHGNGTYGCLEDCQCGHPCCAHVEGAGCNAGHCPCLKYIQS